MGCPVFVLFVDNFVYMEIAWEICYTADFYRSQNGVIVCRLKKWAAVYSKEKVISYFGLVVACLNNLWSFFAAIRVTYLYVVLLHYFAVVGT
jgi:hypothetical protein